MSDLVYQNYNNKCQGWVNPSNIMFGPQITGLSGYQSPSGSSTVVAINGNNFFSYSTILFGTFNPTVYFINSNLLEFYVPNTLNSGIFPVQVFNGSTPSNIVNYTIDNASGYWLLNSNGSITNTNSSGVNVSWLSRGVPTIVNNDNGPYTLGSPYVITDNQNWIVAQGKGQPVYVKLPNGSQYKGRELMLKSYDNDIYSIINNVKNLNGTTVTDFILIGGNWVTLVCIDGVNWEVMQQN